MADIRELVPTFLESLSHNAFVTTGSAKLLMLVSKTDVFDGFEAGDDSLYK